MPKVESIYAQSEPVYAQSELICAQREPIYAKKWSSKNYALKELEFMPQVSPKCRFGAKIVNLNYITCVSG